MTSPASSSSRTAASRSPSNTEQGVGAGASCQNTDVAPSPDTLATVIASTLCLLNGERQDAGLAPLAENAKLASAAIVHSQDMVDQQYFDHAGRDGTDPVHRIRSAGYIPNVGAWTVGENLAWGTGTLATPKEIVQAWMNSTGHRDNILRPTFKEIGFGVVVGNPRSTDGTGATYTTTFGGLTNSGGGARRQEGDQEAQEPPRPPLGAARPHRQEGEGEGEPHRGEDVGLQGYEAPLRLALSAAPPATQAEARRR